ncbi:MAG: hypothetical protein JWR42_226 [Marmoricola sp.]|nr:hypothetical protein [Marmoricola sp.]
MTGVVRSIDHRAPLEEVLDGLVHGATRVFPEVDHAAVRLTHRHGQIDNLALTGNLARELGELQEWLREGPTFDAIGGDDTVVLNGSGADDRWPRYTAAAAGLGLRAQMAVRLYRRTSTAATMTFASTSSLAFSPDTCAVAEVYAGHVGAVVSRAQSEDAWTTAVDSRQVIGQATGILMERHAIDADEAFSRLVKMSTTSNTKLREIARGMVSCHRSEHDPAPTTNPRLRAPEASA